MTIVCCSRCRRVAQAGVLCPVCSSPLPNPSSPWEDTKLVVTISVFLLGFVVMFLGMEFFMLFAKKGIIVLSFFFTMAVVIGNLVFQWLRRSPQCKARILSRRSLSIDGDGNWLDVYGTGEEVFVGKMGYQVFSCWYTHRLSDYQDVRPFNTFLYVDVKVMNRDKKQRAILPFKLYNQYDASYAPCCNSPWSAEGGFGNRIGILNPGEEKRVYVVFDVPRNYVDVFFNVPRNLTYQLLVEGGFWSSALIDLQSATKD